jgi:hypothetical protein
MQTDTIFIGNKVAGGAAVVKPLFSASGRCSGLSYSKVSCCCIAAVEHLVRSLFSASMQMQPAIIFIGKLLLQQLGGSWLGHSSAFRQLQPAITFIVKLLLNRNPHCWVAKSSTFGKT